GGSALVRDVHDIDPGRALEQLRCEMRGIAGNRAVVELTRPRLRKGDQLLDRPGRHGRMRDDDERRRGDQYDRREIAYRVVWQLAIQARMDGERPGRAHQQRMPVGYRPRGDFRPDVAASARAVLDDDLLAETLRQRLGNEPREQVRWTARNQGHDQPHGLRRISTCGPDGLRVPGSRTQQ